jgi:TNF receptor-associated factor 2
MARPHGYPPDIFPEAVDNKYKCTYCTNILRNPIQSFCGHRFCKDCIQFLVSQEKRDVCPSCAIEGVDTEFSSLTLEQTFPDNAIKRELYSMRTVCPFKRYGCQWSGSFKDLEVHYTTCEHREVDCHCGLKYPLSQQTHHLANECLLREVACQYCQEKVVFNYRDGHYEICRRYPVECETCQERITRDQIGEHNKRNHSQLPSASCPYQCGKPVSEGNLQSHIEQNVTEHMGQLLKRQRTIEVALGTTATSSVTAPINKSINERLTTAEDKIRSIEERLTASNAPVISTKGSAAVEIHRADSGIGTGGTQAQGTDVVYAREATVGAPMQSQIASMQVSLIAEKMPIYEGVITVLNREVEKLTMQMETMERQRRQEREQLDTMDRKVKALERTVALKDVTISELDLRITALEQTSYEGTLLWKITDFSRRRQEAISGRMTSIYSPMFYTSKTGYKMCARLYLNGDGMGKGTHVSLFFVIMRGQYDALLKWPFRQKVTLMFLDQSGKDQHVMDAFRPDPTSSSFKRPTTEMNIASGCPLFMSLTQLDSPMHAFVKDNSAFLKIIVNCEDLN